jgi:riboflavin synthase
MFTGIIEEIGTIAGISKLTGKWELSVQAALLRGGVRVGDSVAVDGVCLTATRVAGDLFYADASLETLSVTTLKDRKRGDRVNVERALSADGRLGGHIVMGHVDGIGTIVDKKRAGDSVMLAVEVPSEISRYIVQKGSVAIDGISLTVNEQRDSIFTVNIIPYTASQTTLGGKNLRDKVNIETDIIGKYVESFVEKRGQRGIDLDFLYAHGYVRGK